MLEVERAADECRLAFDWYRSVLADVRSLRASRTRAARDGDEAEVAHLGERLQRAEQARRHALRQYDTALAALHSTLASHGRAGGGDPSAPVR